MNTSSNKVSYEGLADYYDLLINDEAGQQRYAQFVLDQWNLHRNSKDMKGINKTIDGASSFTEDHQPSILELACGSGMLARIMAAKGFTIDATDLSEPMIEVAKQAKGNELSNLTFFPLDMRHFDQGTQYDMILCFCDSINYLREGCDIASMFGSVYKHLKSDGLFLFDCHSIDRLEEFKEGYEEANTIDDLEYQWNIDTVGDELHQHLQIWDDSYVPLLYVEEWHYQKVYSSEWMMQTLHQAGFSEIEVYTDFDTPGVVSGEKQFYVCRREA